MDSDLTNLQKEIAVLEAELLRVLELPNLTNEQRAKLSERLRRLKAQAGEGA